MHSNTKSSKLVVTTLALALSLSLSLSAVAAGTASATPAIATAAEPEKPKERRTEVDLGMLAGGSDIGDTQRQTVGLHLNIGRRFGDLVVLGEYDYLSVGETGSTGTMSRFGAVARYSLLRTKRDFDRPHKNSPVSGDYWLEAGAGLERLTWDSGGTLTRPDLVLGFGLQLDAVLGRKSDKPRYFGPYVSFRTIVARAPDSVTSAPATCASVCDTMTAPSQNDVSMFFHFGVNWGR